MAIIEMTSTKDVIRKCPFCGKMSIVTVDEQAFNEWQKGALIQKAFPNTTPEFRELLLTGICNKCFP